ncbi:MAG TPA: winged helix-turn-helix domain-containing tetratricopeptide repeat protein [Steroidobacteraceae bacterium]
MTSKQAHLTYEFGEFRLDPLRRVLSRDDGSPLQVTGKIFDTLQFFVERAGQLLDKRTLIETLWPNVVVEEGNLTQTIHTLRRLLGERPDDHRYIVTVPGRGYRFVAQVTTRTCEEPQPAAPEPIPETSAQRPARRRALAASAAVMIVLAGAAFWLLQGSRHAATSATSQPTQLSIAVMPFVDLSEAQDQEYFAEGLSEEILNLLAQSTSLRVTARTSSFAFKGRTADIATIADALKVTHVLEGSVRKSGNRVRVTAQLIDSAGSVHLWSQTYDRDLNDVFGIQDEIAASVAESLQVTLTGTAQARPVQTGNAAAFERYLQGKYFFNRRGASDLERAQDYFQQALQLDPNFGRAWAGLAGVYTITTDRTPPGSVPEWGKAVERALQLGPNIAESHVRAAQYYWRLGRPEISEVHCHRAIALNPSDPLVLSVSASREFEEGHWSEGIALQRRAVAVDPLAAVGRGNLGNYLATIGEWDEAVRELEKARELSPTLNGIDSEIAKVQILRQQFNEALAAIDRIPAGQVRDSCLALTYRAPGQRAAADAALARLEASADVPVVDATLAIWIAEVYAYRGDNAAALKWADKALLPTDPEEAREWTRVLLVTSPFLRVLHADARWHTLLARADAP